MRNYLTSVLGVLAILSVAASPALAQEEGPSFVEVTTIDVSPIEVPAFEELVQTFVKAAEEADLAEEFGWLVYQANNSYHLVSFHETLADFDDPNRVIAEFAGTAGMATLQDAIAQLSNLHFSATTNVSRYMDDWSYRPENGAASEEEHSGVVIFEAWVQPGHDEDFGANTLEVIGLLGEIDFPYPVYGHQGVIGDGGYQWWVMFIDDLSSFYGDNAFADVAAAAGAQDKAGEIFGARSQMLMGSDNHPATRRDDMSYMPDM